MKVNKVVKELSNYIEQFPELQLIGITRSKHFKLRVSTPSGERLLVVAFSPSDSRGAANNRSLIKQWARLATTQH